MAPPELARSAPARTTVEVARLYATAFEEDRVLAAWAERTFARPFSLFLGMEEDNPPSEAQTPFLVLLPRTTTVESFGAAVIHDIGLVAGIRDDAFIEQPGRRDMRGLLRLGELCALLESGLRRTPAGAGVEELALAYAAERFPLLLGIFSITLKERLPVGRP